ncbi:hypothetical protein [Bradyrhizobium sp.]|uniref:hypothetical protein n=1 Tax=Bradyrhizobium sp. TaxID=376 RepID=UPI0023963DC8|nr:hypothetical protein [Bradyrhizobium sp.]MDE2376443.1 hypothetical protein [Bradyrhizobium sp.]
MRFVRTILALAIAASLALLPVSAAATGLAGAAGHGAMGVQADPSRDMAMDHATMMHHMAMDHMAMDQMAMDDCCPGAKANPCHPDGGKCPLGFCVAPFVAAGDISALAFDFPSLGRDTVPIPADQVVSLIGGSPPFRPPRV